ncbi:MAG: hypothetical protein HOQ24_10920 [Mycobacteriaceae bacterium]|nr:hypothetical protein [Mycobacteriaceae bacterium]
MKSAVVGNKWYVSALLAGVASVAVAAGGGVVSAGQAGTAALSGTTPGSPTPTWRPLNPAPPTPQASPCSPARSDSLANPCSSSPDNQRTPSE